MTRLAILAFAATAALLPTAAIAQITGGSSAAAGGSGAAVSPGTSFQGGAVSGSVQGGTVVRTVPHIRRGFFVPPMWFGPQFHVQNWQAYNFAQPAPGQRWVRYYGDAYLVDQYGRVVDTRTGLDWDEHGERWSEEGGIPHYEGRGDWRPREREYSWYQQNGYGPGAATAPAPGYPVTTTTTTYGASGQPVTTTTYGAPGGYNYSGYGTAYPIIIETTVTYPAAPE